ncbi:MAG: multidrug efflux SMR transporter [Candidatus Dependentiae bacterium]|nr:multidrug efflux SMR transporter [Candidatus Dependentiae bacterium]
MAWLYLLLAGIMEVVWAVGLKYSEGFTKLVPSVVTIVGALLSVWLLGLALRTIPLGTAYAVWTGIGILGTVIFGVICFSEPVSVLRIISILLIVLGIMGLKFLGASAC